MSRTKICAALLVACLTLNQSASADEFASKPLKGFTVCDSPVNFVVISNSADKFLPPGAIDKIQQAVRTKLTAYRMLTSSQVCAFASKRSYPLISIIVTDAVSYDYRGYSVETILYANNQGGIDGSIDLWNTVNAGVSRLDAGGLLDSIINTIKNHIDELAADYATANP